MSVGGEWGSEEASKRDKVGCESFGKEHQEYNRKAEPFRPNSVFDKEQVMHEVKRFRRSVRTNNATAEAAVI